MTITLKPLEMGNIEPVDAVKEVETHPIAEPIATPVKEFTTAEIDLFALRSYANKCERFHEDPRAFAAFIINISGELHFVSFASSPTETTDRKKLVSKHARNQLTHVHPLVLARRGLIRYFIKEIKDMEASKGVSKLLERNEEGEIQMKKGCHVYMYSTYSHVCENVYWGIEAIKGHDINHCIMNKIRRWTMLGLQGALLSNVLAPIYFSKFVIGSTPPVPVADLWNLLFKDLDFNGIEEPTVESVPRTSPNISLDRTIVWYKGLTGLDKVDNNGRMEDGIGSCVCKEEIFKAYLQLAGANKSILKYSRAKKKAGHYQALKKVMYKKWETENNGKWSKKKSNKADKFWIYFR